MPMKSIAVPGRTRNRCAGLACWPHDAAVNTRIVPAVHRPGAIVVRRAGTLGENHVRELAGVHASTDSSGAGRARGETGLRRCDTGAKAAVGSGRSMNHALPDQVVEILVADWEIECCAPPPVIGAVATWSLEFVSATDELAREDIWTVTHRDDGAVLLDRVGIHAAWNTSVAPPPRAGTHMLRGRLHGTVHGSVRGAIPDGLPPVSGRVQRIRIVSHQFVGDHSGHPSPHHTSAARALREVRECPRWFNRETTAPGWVDTGVLIDMAVRHPDRVEPI